MGFISVVINFCIGVCLVCSVCDVVDGMCCVLYLCVMFVVCVIVVCVMFCM